MENNKIEFGNDLDKFAYKYGSDKCPQVSHPYTSYYYEMFKDRRDSIKKVLEMGIGTNDYMHYHPGHYITGASLRMWRDFFPNAQIYGADILAEAQFKDERIETFLCDQRNENDLKELIEKTGSDIDIFIDDGMHSKTTQIKLCQAIMPMLKKDVIYIIEDVMRPERLLRHLQNYNCENPDLGARKSKEDIIIVKNK